MTYRPERNHLPLKLILAYSAPGLGMGIMVLLYAIYLFKYCTDVLLIAPGVMGVLYGLARTWDAISDPLAGYLSDNTRSRYGRRRIWIISSIPLLIASFFMLWCPPVSLTGNALVIWIGAALLLYSTATTCLFVPHWSLGMELTPSYHERTRLFGIKHMVFSLGALMGFAVIGILTKASQAADSSFYGIPIRSLALLTASIGSAIVAATILYTFWNVHERQDYLDKGSPSISQSFKDIWHNPYARIILLVHAAQSFGTGTLGLLVTYIMQYVLKAPPSMMGIIFASYALPTVLFIPLWIRMSKKVGKKNLLLLAIITQGVAFSAMFFVREDTIMFLIGCAVLVGMANGCGFVIEPSIKADVIDYDELATGQRKEGAYLSVWSFMQKTAMGLAAIILGAVLQWVGFEANVEQPENVKTTLMALFGLLPGAACFYAAWVFHGFKMTETEHNAVRASIDPGFVPK